MYLGIVGRSEAIAGQMGRPAPLTSRHRGILCSPASRRCGVAAYHLAGVAMPSEYDTESSQAWCRNRIAFLMHDLMNRITERRAAVGDILP